MFWISTWLIIVMSMLLLLCFVPLIYLSVFSLICVCCGVCAPLEYKQSGIGVVAWARGWRWRLFSCLSFGSLMESLWYVTLGQVVLYFVVSCLIHFGVVKPLSYPFVIKTLYVKLYCFRCLNHMIIFCWFLCLVKHVWHSKCWVKIELFYYMLSQGIRVLHCTTHVLEHRVPHVAP